VTGPADSVDMTLREGPLMAGCGAILWRLLASPAPAKAILATDLPPRGAEQGGTGRHGVGNGSIKLHAWVRGSFQPESCKLLRDLTSRGALLNLVPIRLTISHSSKTTGVRGVEMRTNRRCHGPHEETRSKLK